MRTTQLGPLTARITGGSDGRGGGSGPVVVLLHGFGAPGTDLVPLANELDVPESVRFVFPEALLALEPYGFGDGRAWWMLDLEEMQRAIHGGYRPDRSASVPDGLLPARAALSAALDAIQAELGVTGDQLVLGGFSQGAMVSCDAVATSDREFAGLVILSGTMLAEPVWVPGMQKRRGLPVIQSHGTADPLLPYDAAIALRDHWVQAGADVSFLPFAGGHTIVPAALDAMSALIRKIAAASAD